MRAVDVVLACGVVLVLIGCAALLARQRYMMRTAGGQAVAILLRADRWAYGIGRYAGGELRWYRAFGVGTRPSRVLERSNLTIVRHRKPETSELNSLPASAVIVDCRDTAGMTHTLAFGDSGFTGFVSWLESSAPMP